MDTSASAVAVAEEQKATSSRLALISVTFFRK
jgi:hypothetical protein